MIKNTEQIEYKKMDKARAGRPPPPLRSSLHRLHDAFLLWIQWEKSNLYGNIYDYIFYIAYAVILLAFDVKIAYTAYKPNLVQP